MTSGSELLLELFSEEIPARMQAQAARALERMAAERLRAQGLTLVRVRTFAGPRRLTLVVDGLPAAQADVREERKGPRATAPEAAVAGFLRSTGLTRDQLTERHGVLFGVIERAGRPTPAIIAEIVADICGGFPWPKSMRSGHSAFRWVRPLKSVLCLFGGEVVQFAVDGVLSGRETCGHRFMGDLQGKPFSVDDFDDYREKLRAQFVILDPLERRERIASAARALCAAQGLELVEDEGLLDEVTGLAEWPTPVLGAMDAGFLDLPPEVIRTSMRTHQKYFSVRRPGEPGLAPHFVVVANVEASDGGASLAAGNARVLSARLNDARFFWNEDRKPGAFERWAQKLKGVTFHAKLGSMAERVERIAALAREIAPLVGADADLTERAARLCKLDLASQMVGEFPELQGMMGGYYARLAGDPDTVADAVRDHYKPQGPGDSAPTAPVTVAVALADKLDTLVGFFAIDEKPTGSRDPYALRRAALGVIRLLLKAGLRLPLKRLMYKAAYTIPEMHEPEYSRFVYGGEEVASLVIDNSEAVNEPFDMRPQYQIDILDFFADRLKVLLRDGGKRHDLVDAVFALGDDDLVRITAKVDALSAFLATDDGANLLAGYKRASNILKAEAKKAADEDVGGAPDPALMHGSAERDLASALQTTVWALDVALQNETFDVAMTSLAALRAPVDAFFDHVLVNDLDPQVRLNRLRLLATMRDAANRVADFSLISG